jgi:5-methyltetrahydropteroyltriglutamate--homocysteine methyltransferase
MVGALIPITPVVCVGPVKYRSDQFVQIDIANVKAAAKAAGVPDKHVFLPATAPSGVGINEYYKSDEEYFQAIAAELNKEYRPIVAAGLLVSLSCKRTRNRFIAPVIPRAGRHASAHAFEAA